MVTHLNLERSVPAGQIIKPWLILGPFYQDLSATVQGLTFFERSGASVGRDAMAEIAEQALPLLASSMPRRMETIIALTISP